MTIQQKSAVDEALIKKKKAVYRLKAKILDEVTLAMDNDMSNEEILGTIETVKHQISTILIDRIKFKKQEMEDVQGYR